MRKHPWLVFLAAFLIGAIFVTVIDRFLLGIKSESFGLVTWTIHITMHMAWGFVVGVFIYFVVPRLRYAQRRQQNE